MSRNPLVSTLTYLVLSVFLVQNLAIAGPRTSIPDMKKKLAEGLAGLESAGILFETLDGKRLTPKQLSKGVKDSFRIRTRVRFRDRGQLVIEANRSSELASGFIQADFKAYFSDRPSLAIARTDISLKMRGRKDDIQAQLYTYDLRLKNFSERVSSKLTSLVPENRSAALGGSSVQAITALLELLVPSARAEENWHTRFMMFSADLLFRGVMVGIIGVLLYSEYQLVVSAASSSKLGATAVVVLSLWLDVMFFPIIYDMAAKGLKPLS